MLVDTLQAYFEGRKELFEGLRIMQMEKDWLNYPVVRLDMSGAGACEDSLRSYLDSVFADYEAKYGVEPKPTASLAVRFDSIIRVAHEKTGLLVVVLIDEYDLPFAALMAHARARALHGCLPRGVRYTELSVSTFLLA